MYFSSKEYKRLHYIREQNVLKFVRKLLIFFYICKRHYSFIINLNVMKRLIFNQEELSELEVLQIKGGGSDDTVPTVQYACGNSAIGCGGGVTQLYCMNYTIGCGSSEPLPHPDKPKPSN